MAEIDWAAVSPREFWEKLEEHLNKQVLNAVQEPGVLSDALGSFPAGQRLSITRILREQNKELVNDLKQSLGDKPEQLLQQIIHDYAERTPPTGEPAFMKNFLTGFTYHEGEYGAHHEEGQDLVAYNLLKLSSKLHESLTPLIQEKQKENEGMDVEELEKKIFKGKTLVFAIGGVLSAWAKHTREQLPKPAHIERRRGKL